MRQALDVSQIGARCGARMVADQRGRQRPSCRVEAELENLSPADASVVEQHQGSVFEQVVTLNDLPGLRRTPSAGRRVVADAAELPLGSPLRVGFHACAAVAVRDGEAPSERKLVHCIRVEGLGTVKFFSDFQGDR